MFPQPKKYGRYVALAIFLLFAYKNPTAAAHMVEQAGGVLVNMADAAGKFAAALQA
ncbi:hypothetical protein GCM10023085_50530 [Actinomadura viridis]|uniref:Uncharacterized protein n=1 Tax=Actinomadura viridis TaxID=58110 RepID=A0A931DLV9_9ACTN|nr:hypothetical protein [Actinomadura viridis]MBG6092365.1 hypothetical protein [Actinomadura viridis]